MRLATLADGTRDGALVVVTSDGLEFTPAAPIARTLQAALDDWDITAPALLELSRRATRREVASMPLAGPRLLAPLPRAYEWIDGSAYVNHVELVRKARGAEPPPTLRSDPLVYQGGSGVLLGPTDPLMLPDVELGLDFEAELVVVLGDVERGTRAEDAHSVVRLLMLANDVTYRNLVPRELEKGFGFFGSKPATAFSPFAVTPDELGGAFRDGRVFLPLCSTYNGALIGDPEAGPEMHFSFFDLIAHIAQTRAFTAGTLLGSGTVSNRDRARGVSCLVERRMLEILDSGRAVTEFMRPGDTIRIEMRDSDGRSIFGRIEQEVVSA